MAAEEYVDDNDKEKVEQVSKRNAPKYQGGSRELNDEDEVCTAQRLAKLISINLKASSTNSSQFQGPKAPQHLNGHVPSQETCPSPL
ncbi:hypothetical protein V6N13_063727 [Hibiscus sabdariffa]